MKLSIITINYNNLEGLRRTIDSVMAQTWRDFEWIIIDGGSTDGSRELIEASAARPEANISYWCSEPDKGVYNAMNKGIAHATGDYLNFMNSGDCFNEDIVLHHIFEDKEFNADVLYGDICFVRSDYYEERKAPSPLLFSHILKHSLYHQSSFIKRTTILKFGYDEKYKIVSDWKLWVQLQLANCSFEHLDYIVSKCDPDGISRKNLTLNQNERSMVLKECVSDSILSDYQQLFLHDKINSYNPELTDIYRLLSSRRFFKRIIRSVIKVLSLFE